MGLEYTRGFGYTKAGVLRGGFTRVIPGMPTLLKGTPLILTSIGGHLTGRYAFYWNAFLY